MKFVLLSRKPLGSSHVYKFLKINNRPFYLFIYFYNRNVKILIKTI